MEYCQTLSLVHIVCSQSLVWSCSSCLPSSAADSRCWRNDSMCYFWSRVLSGSEVAHFYHSVWSPQMLGLTYSHRCRSSRCDCWCAGLSPPASLSSSLPDTAIATPTFGSPAAFLPSMHAPWIQAFWRGSRDSCTKLSASVFAELYEDPSWLAVCACWPSFHGCTSRPWQEESMSECLSSWDHSPESL